MKWVLYALHLITIFTLTDTHTDTLIGVDDIYIIYNTLGLLAIAYILKPN